MNSLCRRLKTLSCLGHPFAGGVREIVFAEAAPGDQIVLEPHHRGGQVRPPDTKSRGAAREQMRADLAAAIVRLKDDLIGHCHLGENDLPHSPRERMSEA